MSHSSSETALRTQVIHETLNRYITEKKVPGMVVAVERFGEPVYFECLGLMDVESQKPMQPDTIFRIASMTKPIVSVAMLILMEAGRLSLDDPLSKYIPEFADTRVFTGVKEGKIQTEALERPITLYHLITHTSGLCSDHPEPLFNQLFQQLDAQELELSLKESVSKLAQIPLAHQPGDGWIYGRSYEVLGHIIALVMGQPLDNALTELVLSPLKMVDTDYYVPSAKHSRLATLYGVVENGLEVSAQSRDIWPWVRPEKYFSGGGGLLSSAADYLRFARMLLNKGELDDVRILKPETVEMMTRNHLTGNLYPLRFGDFEAQGEGYGMGFGVIVDPTVSALAGSQGAYTWSGSYSTHFWIDPQNQLIGMVLSQFEPMFQHPIHVDFRAAVYAVI